MKKILEYFSLKLLICFISVNVTICQKNIFSQNSCGYKITTTNCNPTIINKEANVWYFGKNAGLNFNTIPPSVLNNAIINQLEGSASISDKSGNFLFTTNGEVMDLINNSFQEIPNSDHLDGHYSATQNAIIIPQPGHDNIYFVFTVGINLPYPYGRGLNYTIVDMSDNGSIVNKNNSLLPSISEKITAVKHENGKDYWIIVHEWGSRKFLAYLLTEDGLKSPVISETGTEHTQDDLNNNAIGYLKVSPDGCKIAQAIYGKAMVELLDFDKATGKITNAITSNPVFTGAYGIEFSTDSKMLYLSTNDYVLNSPFNSTLYQFTIDNGSSVFDNPVVLASDSIIDYLGLQLATDGKIYVASSIREQLPLDGYDYIGVINNPTRAGSACNFNNINHQSNNGIFLNGGKCRIGLPNFIQSYFYIPKFTYTFNCFNDSTQFTMVNPANVDSVLWNFGDSTFSTERNPHHSFRQAKDYYVKLTDYFNGIGYTDSLLVIINDLPKLLINNGMDTTFIFPNEDIVLDAGSGFQSYLWSTGSTNQSIRVNEVGLYTVTVINENCCEKTDSIYVKIFELIVPTAFLPKSSGQDREFKVIDYYNAVKDFKISIFNRLGKMVFTSDDITKGWDGNNSASDVFYYKLKVVLKNGKEIHKEGNITLIN